MRQRITIGMALVLISVLLLRSGVAGSGKRTLIIDTDVGRVQKDLPRGLQAQRLSALWRMMASCATGYFAKEFSFRDSS